MVGFEEMPALHWFTVGGYKIDFFFFFVFSSAFVYLFADCVHFVCSSCLTRIAKKTGSKRGENRKLRQMLGKGGGG